MALGLGGVQHDEVSLPMTFPEDASGNPQRQRTFHADIAIREYRVARDRDDCRAFAP